MTAIRRPPPGDGAAPPNRQAARSERSTEALLAAAAELAAEGGLSAMTFAAIGERAGYSRGLVTARFGSKAGLVDAMIRRMWRHMRVPELLGDARGRAGLDQILDLLAALRAGIEADPIGMRSLTVLLLEAAVGADDHLQDRFRRFHQAMVDELATVIARGVADGSVRPEVDPRAEAVYVVGAVRGLSYLWVLDPECFDPLGAYDHLTAAVHARLAR